MKRTLALGLAAAAVAVAGCSVAPGQTVSPTPSPAAVNIPADGITLRELGFTNGPNSAFSVPRDSVITMRIDQVNVVTLYLSDPPPATVLAYYRRSLPGTGFEVSADKNSALLFTGFGWDGSIVGGKNAAITLRRQ